MWRDARIALLRDLLLRTRRKCFSGYEYVHVSKVALDSVHQQILDAGNRNKIYWAFWGGLVFYHRAAISSLQQAYSLARHNCFTDRIHGECIVVRDTPSTKLQCQRSIDLLNNKNLVSRTEMLNTFGIPLFPDTFKFRSNPS